MMAGYKTNVPVLSAIYCGLWSHQALGPLDIPIFSITTLKNNLVLPRYVRGNIVISPDREGYFENLLHGVKSVGRKRFLLLPAQTSRLIFCPQTCPSSLLVGYLLSQVHL